MKADFVVGIDVAGEKRGFQCAILRTKSNQIEDIFDDKDPENVLENIRGLDDQCLQVAIDSPPKAHIDIEENKKRDGKTRLAERQLNKKGFNVQWTPRDKYKTDHARWMKNGERLWDKLTGEFGNNVIETFPTACVKGLKNIDVNFPLSLIKMPKQRQEVKDYFDAAVCAVVAREVANETDLVRVFGRPDENDKYDDELEDVLGPIHVLES